jgi:hypothetical protein
MASFPLRETDIVALAHDIAAGLAVNADIFATPPHGPDEINAALAAVASAHDAAVLSAAQGAGALSPSPPPEMNDHQSRHVSRAQSPAPRR